MGQHYSTITKISVFQIFQCYYICATYCMWGAVAARSLFLWRWGQERGNTNDCKQQLFSFLISMLFIFSIIWLVGLWNVWKWWKMLITRAQHDVLKYLVLSLAQRFSVYWNQKVLTFRSLESNDYDLFSKLFKPGFSMEAPRVKWRIVSSFSESKLFSLLSLWLGYKWGQKVLTG